MGTEVAFSGPLFDGSLQRNLERAVVDAVGDAAVEAVRVVRRTDARSFRRSTGHTSSRVGFKRSGPTGFRVHGGGLVWRPWLEGTAPRNRKSSFKGHGIFRRSRTPVRDESVEVIEAAVRRVL